VEFDLDEAVAAREEARGEARHAVVFRGERLVLPASLPIGFLEHLATYLALTQKARDDRAAGRESTLEVGASTNELFQSAAVLLGPEGWQRFKDLGATLDEVLALLQGTLRLFKVGEDRPGQTAEDAVGESPASGSPSSDSGALSRPTGNGSTDAISDATSTDAEESVSAGSGP
jgi:hypothetical protein